MRPRTFTVTGNHEDFFGLQLEIERITDQRLLLYRNFSNWLSKHGGKGNWKASLTPFSGAFKLTLKKAEGYDSQWSSTSIPRTIVICNVLTLRFFGLPENGPMPKEFYLLRTPDKKPKKKRAAR